MSLNNFISLTVSVFLAFAALSFEDLNVTKACTGDNSYCFPRIIWAFWDKVETIPEDIQEMLNVTHNSVTNFTYHLLHEETIPNFLDMKTFPSYYQELVLACRADYMRVCLLAKYGGLWIDAATYVTSGSELEWFFAQALEKKAHIISFSFFSVNHMSPNFFGAPENSVVMRKYKEDYDYALKTEVPRDYNKQICKKVGRKDCRFYVMIDTVYANVLYENPALKKMQLLLPVERSHYKLDKECNRQKQCIHDRLLHDPAVRRYPFTKMQHRNRLGKKINFFEMPTKEYHYKFDPRKREL